MGRITDKFKESCSQYLELESQIDSLRRKKDDLKDYLTEFISANGEPTAKAKHSTEIVVDNKRWVVTQATRVKYNEEAGIVAARSMLVEDASKAELLKGLIVKVEKLDHKRYEALKQLNLLPGKVTKAYECGESTSLSLSCKELKDGD